jgi:hypothetical protein
MDTFYVPANKLWNKAMDWVRSFWMPARSGPNGTKFGAGQSSDGRTKSTSSF